MTLLMSTTPQYRFDIETAKKERVDACFAKLGVMKKTGMNRLVDWFLAQPYDAQRNIVVPGASSSEDYAIGRNDSATTASASASEDSPSKPKAAGRKKSR